MDNDKESLEICQDGFFGGRWLLVHEGKILKGYDTKEQAMVANPNVPVSNEPYDDPG